jgi:hypothetical protein
MAQEQGNQEPLFFDTQNEGTNEQEDGTQQHQDTANLGLQHVQQQQLQQKLGCCM